MLNMLIYLVETIFRCIFVVMKEVYIQKNPLHHVVDFSNKK